MDRLKRFLIAASLPSLALALIGTTAFLQLTVHDPKHILLTSLGAWGFLSIPVGLLFGHAALSERR